MGGWFNDTQNPPMMEAERQKIISVWLIYKRIFASFENIFVSEVFHLVFTKNIHENSVWKNFGGALKWYQGIYVRKYIIYIYIYIYIFIYIYIYIYYVYIWYSVWIFDSIQKVGPSGIQAHDLVLTVHMV